MEISWFQSASFVWGTPPPEGGTLTLEIGADHRIQWLDFLSRVAERGVGKESRMSFTVEDQGVFTWTLFVKEITGQTQALLAHPEKMEWVGTLRINSEDLKRVRKILEEKPTSRVEIFSLLKNKKTSNFNLVLNVTEDSKHP